MPIFYSDITVHSKLTIGVDDTGYDVKFFGATSGRYMLWDESEDNLVFADNVNAAFGTSSDMLMYHDGSNNYIDNVNGYMYMRQLADDKDIAFQCDDGSGGVETYFYLDGSVVKSRFKTAAVDFGVDDTGIDVTFYGATASKNLLWDESADRLIFADNTYLALGSGSDMLQYHTDSHGYIANQKGNFYIQNTADDGDIVFKSDDGSGGNATYLTLDGGLGYITVQKQMKFDDSVQLQVGSSSDAWFQHDGTKTQVGNITGDLQIINYADDKDVILASDDGSGGTAAYITLDGSAGYTTSQKEIRWVDAKPGTWGTSGDLLIWHTGTNSEIINYTGDLYFKQGTDDKDIIFQCDDGSGGLQTYMWMDGSAANGTNTYTRMDDNSMLGWGTGFDMYMYHTGTDSYLTNATGDLIIGNGADDKDIIFQCDDGSGGLATYLTCDGSVGTVVVAKPLIATNRTIAVTSSTDGDYDGDVVYFGGEEHTIAAGQLVHYNSNDRWELADADAAATADGLLGVALGGDADVDGVLLRGMVTIDHDPGAIGDVLFLSTTAGDCSATAPSGNNDVIRVIGYQVSHASNGNIWFNPDNTYVEVSA